MEYDLQLLDNSIYQALNGLVGRSWTLDTLLALSLDNPVVKAGPLGACFFYAWWKQGTPDQVNSRRLVLLITLATMFIIAPIVKTVSQEQLQPRPFVQSYQVYTLQDGVFEPQPLLDYNVPQAGEVRDRYDAFEQGDLGSNDLASFPSDHAALFLAFGFGIFLASWGAGLVALSWAILVTLAPRIALGMHAPIDILGGGLAGIALLLGALIVGRRVLSAPIGGLVDLSDRYRAITMAVMALAVFETLNSMSTLKRLAQIGEAAAPKLIG